METCLECFETVEPRRILDECASCHGHTTWIDENIWLVCKLLNSKGYKTSYCCSGHVWRRDSNMAALIFSYPGELNNPVEFGVLPSNFAYTWSYNETEKRYVVKVSKAYRAENEVELQREIWEAMIGLLRWADKLPCCMQDDKPAVNTDN